MTPEAQRIAIAEACGWTDVDVQGEYCFGTQPARSELDARQFMLELPHYCHDLNAMHEAEKELPDKLFVRYANRIPPCATASQRAEAFLRALNLWRDDA